MGPKTARLIELLETTTALLRACGEMHWSGWLEKDLVRLRQGDFSGVEHFLSTFGGMGSLNDFVLHPENGNCLLLAEVQDVNEKLHRLLTEAWMLAQDLRHEATP